MRKSTLSFLGDFNWRQRARTNIVVGTKTKSSRDADMLNKIFTASKVKVTSTAREVGVSAKDVISSACEAISSARVALTLAEEAILSAREAVRESKVLDRPTERSHVLKDLCSTLKGFFTHHSHSAQPPETPPGV